MDVMKSLVVLEEWDSWPGSHAIVVERSDLKKVLKGIIWYFTRRYFKLTESFFIQEKNDTILFPDTHNNFYKRDWNLVETRLLVEKFQPKCLSIQ